MSAIALPRPTTSITERTWVPRVATSDDSEVVSSRPTSAGRSRRLAIEWEQVARRMANLLALDVADWDTQGADPIEVEAVARAYRLVTHLVEAGAAVPVFTPLTDGGVRAEWCLEDFELWLDVHARGEVRAYATWTQDGSEHEFEDALARAPVGVLDRLLTTVGGA
jgi:hypothetical protein